MRTHANRRLVWAGMLVGLASAMTTLVAAPEALAYSSLGSPITGQTTLVSGLPGSAASGSGPNGVLDDGSHLFVADAVNGTMYRLGENGGNAAASSTLAVDDGLTNGIAKADGVYYAGSRGVAGVDPGVYEFNPQTLARGTEVAHLDKINEIAGDPHSSDLYVTAFTDGLYRVENPNSSSPKIFEVAVGDFHGIGFTSGGADVWVSNVYVNGPSIEEYSLASLQAVSPTSGCAPGEPGACAQPEQVVSLGSENPQLPTGLVVLPAGAKLGNTPAGGNVIVNTSQGDTDLPGAVLRVDTSHGNAISVVASGGSTRGDVAMLDSHGYLDVTQTYSVVRLMPGVAPTSSHVSLPRSFSHRKGAKLTLTLSEAAKVTVGISQLVSGHRSHGRCAASAKRGPRCTTTVKRLTARFAGVAGVDHFTIKTAKLKPGHYRAEVTAANGATATSKTTTISFTLR